MSDIAFAWTEQRVELLTRLWGAGVSCANIALQLGTVTRNGVIGKAHRLDLPARRRPAYTGPQKLRRKVERRAAPKPRPSRAKPPQAKVRRRDIPPPEALMISMMELGMRSCRWPIGDGPFLFCGLNNFNGQSYCEAHTRLAYLPVTSRAERDRQRQAARWAA